MDSSSQLDLVESLAEEFRARRRKGEKPTIEEYVGKFPDLAEHIREIFPALAVLEDFGSVAGDAAPIHVSTRNIPQQLGDFRLLRMIGSGGMGVVYEAMQLSLGRHVALKVLPFQSSLSPTYLERFRREARAAAHFHHSNIVPIFGVGEHEGIHFYAMQYIHGQGLDQVLHEVRRLRNLRPITESLSATARNTTPSLAESVLHDHYPAPPESVASANSSSQLSVSSETSLTGKRADYYRSVARIAVQVAQGLDYAHRQGILHRDIKPSNLLLDMQGQVWITDFGLAKVEGNDELTGTGDIVGTLRYMAPERFKGQADGRSDVYSLGLTMYEMLTLRAAFEASDRGRLIDMIRHENPTAPRRVDANVPRDLETIVLKATEKEPHRRYPSAIAFAEDLQRFLQDQPIQARPSPWYQRSWKWARRRPAVASLVAMLVVAIFAGLGVSNYYAYQAREALATTSSALSATQRQEQQTREALDQLASHQYTQRILLADLEYTANNVRRAETVLEECAPEQRCWEWNYLKRLCRSYVHKFEPAPGVPVLMATFVGDTGQVACLGQNGVVSLYGSDGCFQGDFRVFPPLPTRIPTLDELGAWRARFAFSGNGRRLAIANGTDRINLWDVQHGTRLGEIPTLRQPLTSLELDHHGKWLAFGSKADRIANIWDLDALTLFDAPAPTVPNCYLMPIAIHRDDGVMAFLQRPDSGMRSQFSLYHFTKREWVDAPVTSDHRAWFCYDFRPKAKSGVLILGASGLDYVKTFQLPQVKEFFGTRILDHRVTHFAWNPEGTTVASVGKDLTLRTANFGSTGDIKVFRGHGNWPTSTGWSSDGTRLCSSSVDGTVCIWNAHEQPEYRVRSVPSHTNSSLVNGDRSRSVDVSAQSKRISVRNASGEVQREIALADPPRRFFADPNLHWLVHVNTMNQIQLVDLDAGEVVASCRAGKTGVESLAYEPDTRRIALGDVTGRLRVFDVGTETFLTEKTITTARLRQLVWLDSQRLAWIDDKGGFGIVDDRGESSLEVPPATQQSTTSVLALSRDRKQLVRTMNEKIFVLDALGKVQHELAGHLGNITGVAFSPDGKRLASLEQDSQIKLWDLQAGRELLRIHMPAIIAFQRLFFSEDGHRLMLQVGNRVFEWDGSPWSSSTSNTR